MHLIGWFESQDSATLVNVNTLADNTMIPEGVDGYQVPSFANELFAGAALGTTLTRARYTAPSLERRRSTQDVHPIADSAESFALGFPQLYMPMRSVPLDVGEVIRFQAAEDGAGAQSAYGLAWLKPPGDLPAIPPGEVIQARATGTTTLVADEWTTVAVTLEQELPAGRYELVGFIPMGVSVIAARVAIPGLPNRPGVPGLIGATENVSLNANLRLLDPVQNYAMGNFANTAIPQFEYLAAAADTAQTIYLKLVKIA